MVTAIAGRVQSGKIVPQTPLPEGLTVQILVSDAASPELSSEFEQWAAGNAQALYDFESMLVEEHPDAKG